MDQTDKTQTFVQLTNGTEIAHYRIVKKIGEGGMGEVYLAEDSRLNRRVALKFLPQKLAADQELRQRFMREARATARIDHPNVVTVHEVAEFAGRPYFVMSMVEGTTLGDHAAQEKLSCPQIVDFVTQIARGLNAAHKLGVIHRDIKPSNVLVDRQGRVRIVDFGLAFIEGSAEITRTGSTLGTIGYMSPEQVLGERLDPRSDLFSLGVILYELISGRRPFIGDNEGSILNGILNNEPPSLPRDKPDMPDDLRRICFKLLSKTREQRYPTAEVLLTDLDKLGAPGETGPDSDDSPPSIAVLPFSNMSADKENEYFSDGIAEEIINSLSQLQNLRVASRTSSFVFKNQSVDIREVGDRLRVSTVLEGSVRRAANRVRITAQLVSVADGYHLWSEKYDRTMDDIFAIQDEIATTITDKLKVALSASEEHALTRHGTDNMQAYDLYLRGRFYWEQRGRKLETGLNFFQQAVELDPNYAEAYTGIADTCHMMGLYGIRPPHECMKDARANATRALEIDSTLPGAYTALAMVAVLYERDWPAARKYFNKAIELNPKYVQARYWYAFWYLYMYENDTAAALAEGQKGIDVEPLAALPSIHFALILWSEKRFDEVLNIMSRIEAQDPLAFKSYWWLVGACYCGLGDFDTALSYCPPVEKSLRRHQWSVAFHGYILARAGRIDDAQKLQAELERRHKERYVSNFSRAIIPASLGEIEKALDILENVSETRDGGFILSTKLPMFESVQSEERFKTIMVREGLKPQ